MHEDPEETIEAQESTTNKTDGDKTFTEKGGLLQSPFYLNYKQEPQWPNRKSTGQRNPLLSEMTNNILRTNLGVPGAPPPSPLASSSHKVHLWVWPFCTASCVNVGVLGRRGFALESAAARVCREVGARVSVNQLVRDLDIAAPHAGDNRRLEVADGLPLFHGAQLAIDTTMVSPLSRTGLPHARCVDVDGAATVAARRRSGDIRSCQGRKDEPDLWSLLAK